MTRKDFARTAAEWTAAGAAAAIASYAAYVAVTWYRYGHVAPPPSDERDPMLDRFMSTYDVRERHATEVAAPDGVTFAAANSLDVMNLAAVRTLVKARELIFGAAPDRRPQSDAIIPEMQSIGWGVLAEVPGREIVMGAVTRPWEANVVFRALSPDEFSAFDEPDYVKIVWTLRADPIDGGRSLFSTETRAIATDPRARAKFRTYWSFLSPGIILIRLAAVRALRAEVERRVRNTGGRPEGRPHVPAGPGVSRLRRG